MTTSGNTSGCKTGRGLKPSLAAVYSARQQRTNSASHSRQSSPGSRGGGLLLTENTSCQLLSAHSAPTSPTGALNFDVTWNQAVAGSAIRNVGRDRETTNQQSQPTLLRQCSHHSQDSNTSQDSIKSASVESSGPAFIMPSPPQTSPSHKGALHSQRRMLKLPGVTEMNSCSLLGSPRPAWQFSPLERSRDSSPEEMSQPPRRKQRSRDGSITPVMSPVPTCLHFPSSPSRATPSGACFSPRPKKSIKNYDGLSLTSKTSFLQMPLQTGDMPCETDVSTCVNVERLHNLLVAAAVGCRSRDREVSPCEDWGNEESSVPVLREGWQVSLCQNVVLCCPAKLPTKDTFAQRKVPRPVSREGSLKSCDPDSLSSPPSPPSPLWPRGPSTERSAARPRREGRSFQRRPLEEAKTPDEDMSMRDARIQLLMQERRLSSAGFSSPLQSPRGELDHKVRSSIPVLPTSSRREDVDKDERLTEQLYEVKLEIVRGLAAASSNPRRKSIQDTLEGDYHFQR